MTDTSPERALARAAADLGRREQAFALVGGLGCSIRGEVRFTRDVDLAIAVSSDAETERLVHGLVADGYVAIASVAHDARRRLATVRLRSMSGVVIDLLAASSGIEAEVVARAEPVAIDGVGTVPVARAEELLALKVLSMTDARPRDRIDAVNLLAVNPALDVGAVRDLLSLIEARGYGRGEDLSAKLEALLG